MIRLFNTISRSVEPLVPTRPGYVRMFVCGPTVYDFAHLGHAKTYTQFDFIARYLRAQGYKVTYLQNITDVDDKIIKRAAARGVAPIVLARLFEDYYKEDMIALHNTSVDIYARAHDYIPQIVSQVKRLIDAGTAYRLADGYYFDISQFEGYGELSGRTLLSEGDSISRIDDNPGKRYPGDFCLWKFRKEGDPYWDSEIGQGRPGWHIEDTAITEHHFGAQYDLHGGAIDLIFPHHEAEIAQMETISQRAPLVRHWVHTGFLNIRAQKMSKSDGNYLTIRDILLTHNYKAIRYLFLSSHYRSNIEFSAEILHHADNSVRRLDTFIQGIDQTKDDGENEPLVLAFRDEVFSRLDDDFDTPGALAVIHSFVTQQNKRGHAGRRVFDQMSQLNKIFDIMTPTVQPLSVEIEDMVASREGHRRRREFADADRIRDELAGRGIILDDTPDGVRWRYRG